MDHIMTSCELSDGIQLVMMDDFNIAHAPQLCVQRRAALAIIPTLIDDSDVMLLGRVPEHQHPRTTPRLRYRLLRLSCSRNNPQSLSSIIATKLVYFVICV